MMNSPKQEHGMSESHMRDLSLQKTTNTGNIKASVLTYSFLYQNNCSPGYFITIIKSRPRPSFLCFNSCIY